MFCNYDSWFRIRLPPPFCNVFFGQYSVVRKKNLYEYFDSFDKFLGTKLSNEFAFFSSLKVMAFINKIMIMHKLYLKIFNVNHWETIMIFIWKQMFFYKLCLRIFQESVLIIVNSTLHILHESDFELGRLNWLFKNEKCKVDWPNNVYLYLENAIRGGLSMITHRYSEANYPIFTVTQFSHSICRGKDSDGFGKKEIDQLN